MNHEEESLSLQIGSHWVDIHHEEEHLYYVTTIVNNFVYYDSYDRQLDEWNYRWMTCIENFLEHRKPVIIDEI